ncbi:unnamed protein product [Moneuplotes crassus]|uniref:Uncharacterized protein n=1 Tax=Euplotes crassus TaxID=5936 RepID=A0AAD1XYU4_EUPCR|nr:unnamed protein product [Moneuplotes crassus]
MVKKIIEVESDSDSAPEEVNLGDANKNFDSQNKAVKQKAHKKDKNRNRRKNKNIAKEEIDEEDIELLLATKLDDKAFEKLQKKLDKHDKSKSQKIKEKLTERRAQMKDTPVVEPLNPRDNKVYKARLLDKSQSDSLQGISHKSNETTKINASFVIDNKKTRKALPRVNKKLLEFKQRHFHGSRIQRTGLKQLLNKH